MTPALIANLIVTLALILFMAWAFLSYRSVSPSQIRQLQAELRETNRKLEESIRTGLAWQKQAEAMTIAFDMLVNRLSEQGVAVPPHLLAAPPAPPPFTEPPPRVLAVFPEIENWHAIDFAPFERVLRDAAGGWAVSIVKGDRATRLGVARELRHHGADILLFVSHGYVPDGGSPRILLHGKREYVTPHWLSRNVRRYGIRLVVLVSCDSAELVDACMAADVESVVAASGRLPMERGTEVACAFLQALAQGDPVGHALSYALDTVPDSMAGEVKVYGSHDLAWD